MGAWGAERDRCGVLTRRYYRGYTMTMKTAVSIPDELFRAADRVARRLGLSRSEFYQRALALYLENHNDALVTEQLNLVHDGADDGKVDPVLDVLQWASIVREKW